MSIKRYQPSLTAQGSGSKIRDNIRKIQWAVCKREDVAAFEARLRGHVASINLLVATVQMEMTQLQTTKNDEQQAGIISAINQHYSVITYAMKGIKASITNSIATGEHILRSTSEIVSSNFRIYQTVMKIYDLMLTMPMQVLREQPVYFEDAYGKQAPFYLEFVYSADVLQDWLMRRFEGLGSLKIKRGEYVLEDSKTNRAIDLKQNWYSLFRPGMQVAMDMVFEQLTAESSVCPGCGARCGDSLDRRCTWYVGKFIKYESS